MCSFLATGYPFGTTPAEVVFEVSRFMGFFVMALLFFLYNTFPIWDASKRLEMCNSLLSSFAHAETQSCRREQGFDDVPMVIVNAEGVTGFWAISRALGPEFLRGLCLRYNSGYLVVTLVHLCFMSAGVACHDILSEGVGLDWGSVLEIGLCFAIAAVSILATTLITEQCNEATHRSLRVLERARVEAVVRKWPDKDEVVELVDVLGANLADVKPIQMLYMPATKEVLSLVWSFGSYGLALVFEQLRGQLKSVE